VCRSPATHPKPWHADLLPRACAGTCFLATASAELGGHPFGSMVDVAVDAQGRPLFCISTLSGHTKDLAQDARCSVTVQQPHFQGIQDGRCTLVGTVSKVRSPSCWVSNAASQRTPLESQHEQQYAISLAHLLYSLISDTESRSATCTR
jgi:putative heme iron utilization protein